MGGGVNTAGGSVNSRRARVRYWVKDREAAIVSGSRLRHQAVCDLALHHDDELVEPRRPTLLR